MPDVKNTATTCAFDRHLHHQVTLHLLGATLMAIIAGVSVGRRKCIFAFEFYKPLVDALEAYASAPKDTTDVDIVLEYFNTSSSKCILDVFKKLEKINADSSGVTINWHYEEDDEDMLEAGEDYQAIINIPFKMVEIEE